MKNSGPYALYEMNPDLESGIGVQIDFGTYWFRILRAGGSNEKFVAASLKYTKNMKGNSKDLAKSLTEAEAQVLLANIYADAVVIDWGGEINDRAGNPIPFSRDNVFKLLTDLPEQFKLIQAAAEGLELFRMQVDKDDIKKSQASSSIS